MASPDLWDINFFSIWIETKSLCFLSKVVTSPSLNIKSLFLFFSISVSIANKKLIISTKNFKNLWAFTLRSQDLLVSVCIPKLRTGIWKVEDAVKMALKSIKSVETAIIIVMGFHTPPHPKSLEMHFQNTTKDIFQTTTNKLLTPVLSLNLSNCRVRVSGQDGWTIFTKTFLWPLWWQCQLTFLHFVYHLHITHFHLLPS